MSEDRNWVTIAGLRLLLAEFREDFKIVRFEFRRSSDQIADVIAFTTDVKSAIRAEEAFQSLDLTESVKRNGQRVTLRFTSTAIRNWARHAEANLIDEYLDKHSDRSIIVDYCDPNANKPLHIGHLRNILLGRSLAATARKLGHRVVTQSVVCDVGRCIFEAMAGVEHSRKNGLSIPLENVSSFVGESYSNYVAGCSSPMNDSKEFEPVGRELWRHSDAAYELERRWIEHEIETRALWTKLMEAIVAEQRITLARLNADVDQIHFESHSFQDAVDLANRSVGAGPFQKDESGAVIFHSEMENYPRLLLLREDAFPTEHLRAWALWSNLAETVKQANSVIHVLGEEWLPATLLRTRMLSIGASKWDLQNYALVPYGMVVNGGCIMKSSKGTAVLVDDVLNEFRDFMTTRFVKPCEQHPQVAEELAQIALTLSFLSVPARKSIEWRNINPLEAQASGWIFDLLNCLMDPSANSSESPLTEDGDSRFSIVHTVSAIESIQRSHRRLDATEITKTLMFLTLWYGERSRSYSALLLILKAQIFLIEALGSPVQHIRNFLNINAKSH